MQRAGNKTKLVPFASGRFEAGKFTKSDDKYHPVFQLPWLSELKPDHEEDDDIDLKRTVNLELTIWSLTLVSPFDHPATWDVCAAVGRANDEGYPVHVNIERSKPCYGKKWYRESTLLHNRWLQNSLAKQPGAIYSQLPDARIAPVEETALPTRILDLMPGGYIQQVGRAPDAPWSPIVCLVVPGPGARGRYLTLSHRWPRIQSLKLTTANLHQLQQGLHLQGLPPTFRDAAKVALELGYRYLWIDALCIIQDDSQDWLDESTKMCTVYRNSCCTIAAHTSNGLFPHCSTTKTSFRTSIKSLWSKRSTPHKLSKKEESRAYSVLNSRGWVFQERILSKRILHFVPSLSNSTTGAVDVFFEDASGIFTDSTKGIYDPRRCFLPFRSANHPLLEDAKPNLDEVIEKSTQWYRLVERYTQCELTIETDRLPAVAGLARYYHDLNPGPGTTGEYIYGLWTDSLHQGLLWVETCPNVPKKIEASSDGQVPQAPSWSWGLWNSAVRYPYHLAASQSAIGIPSYDHTLPAENSRAGFDTEVHRQYISWRSRPSSVQELPQLATPQSKVLTLPLLTRRFSSLTARLKAQPQTNCPSFPKTPLSNLYDITSLPGKAIRPNWVAFEGRRDRLITFDTEITVALVASNVKVEYFFWLEDEDNKQHRSEEHLYYFLILEQVKDTDIETDTERKTYRRIGIGAVRRTIWWREEEGGRLEVVDIM
ncbi:Heterokaryon incompatibility protein (HET) domain containing protein [Naviculisporaceae sp. PSN 640]